MTTNYINYNVEKIANLEVAQDMALNDYFLIQPQDFNTKAKILPLKNMVVTLDNCTFARQFNQHTSDIETLSTFVQTVDGSRITANSINTNSIKSGAITKDKIAADSIDTSHIIDGTIQYGDLDPLCVAEIRKKVDDNGNVISDVSKLNISMDNITLSAFSNLAIPDYTKTPLWFTGNVNDHRFNVHGTKTLTSSQVNFFTKNTAVALCDIIDRAYEQTSGSNLWWNNQVKPYIGELNYGIPDNNDACVPGLLHIFGVIRSGKIICKIQNTDFFITHDESYNGKIIEDGYSNGQLCIPYLLSKTMVENTSITFSQVSDSYNCLYIHFTPYKQFTS